MEIYKNKKGKCFIFLRWSGEKKGLYITPLGQIKSIEHRFFKMAGSEAEQEITEEQAKRYQEYMTHEKEFGERREDFALQRVAAQEFGKRLTLEQTVELKRRLEKKFYELKRREILTRKF